MLKQAQQELRDWNGLLRGDGSESPWQRIHSGCRGSREGYRVFLMSPPTTKVFCHGGGRDQFAAGTPLNILGDKTTADYVPFTGRQVPLKRKIAPHA